MAKVKVNVIYGTVNGVQAPGVVEIEQKSVDRLVKGGFIQDPKEVPANEAASEIEKPTEDVEVEPKAKPKTTRKAAPKKAAQKDAE